MHPPRRNTPAPAAADGRDPSGSRPAWSIEALVARSSAAACGADAPATIRLDDAAAGIAIDVGEQPTMHLLGLVLDPAMRPAAAGPPGGAPPADHWARGDDVVAVYEPADPRSLRATAMWRRWACRHPGVAAWELVVSCQTSLLESDATVIVRSTLPDAADVMDAERPSDRSVADRRGGGSAATAAALLVRTADGPSVLVAVHPLDAGRLTIRPAGEGPSIDTPAIECHLFPSRVEKGVLLRGRSLAAVGPREDDTAWAARLLAAFRDSPPPLST